MEATIETPPPVNIAPSVSPAIIPQDKLASINATEAALQQITERAAELAALESVQDKDTFDLVHDFVMTALRVRTAAAKLAKTLAKPYQDKADEILTEGKRIGQVARKAEDLVRPLKEAYEADQERLQLEKRQAAAAKIQERTQLAINLGMEWNGTSYVLDQHIIEGVDIQAAPDEKWDLMIKDVIAYREEQILETERLRVEAETARRLETERLEAQREEQAARQKLLDDQQAELDRRQQVIDLAEAKAATDQKRIDEEDQAEKNRQQAIQDKLDQEKAEATRQKTEQKELREKQKADKERQKRLAPDKKLMLALAKSVDALAWPDLANDESRLVQQEFSLQLFDVVDRFRSQIDAL